MSTSIDFTKKCLAVITGASRGIGREIAIQLGRRLKLNSTIILIARSDTGLTETKSLVLKQNTNVSVKTYQLDLSKPDLGTYESLIQENISDFDFSMIFHNAGTLGSVDRVVTYSDINTWRSFLDLNVISTSLLNSAFINKIQSHSKKLFVINISSLCGLQPFKSLGMYGSAKAARNMLFKVLAEEESDVVVFNYCPGPVDTEMVSEIIDNTTIGDIKSMFVNLKKDKKILTAEVTTNKMLDILGRGDLKSGDSIDYYDTV